MQLLDGAQLCEAASARGEAGHGVPEAGADGAEHRLTHRCLPTRSEKTRQRDGEGEHQVCEERRERRRRCVSLLISAHTMVILTI